MDKESVWKPIPEFSLYEMNQFGEVRNCETHRIKKPHYHKNGSKMTSLYSDQPGMRSTSRSVAKLVMQLFGEPCPPDRIPLIEVVDDDPKNTCISNLRWQVPSVRQNAIARKYNNPEIKKLPGHKFKINPLELLALHDSGVATHEIAKRFDVTKNTVNLVIRHYRKAY